MRKHYVPYLMVVNPLRREFQSLPYGDACCEHLSTLGAFDACTSGKWTHIVADEEMRTYTVTVVTRNCFNVYRSDTDRWKCTSKHANTVSSLSRATTPGSSKQFLVILLATPIAFTPWALAEQRRPSPTL